APEAQRDLGLVAVFDEAAQIAQLDLVVAFIGPRPELDFLDLDDLLARARFLLAFLFLVLELAVVHQAADRRAGRGGDFNQIDVVLLGHGHGFGRADNAQLLAIHADQADFIDTDITVDAVFLFGCDVENSCELMKKGGIRPAPVRSPADGSGARASAGRCTPPPASGPDRGCRARALNRRRARVPYRRRPEYTGFPAGDVHGFYW